MMDECDDLGINADSDINMEQFCKLIAPNTER